MRVLVTGATGFVGGHVARHLHSLGYRVRATGRKHSVGAALGLEFVPANLDIQEEALRVCEGQEVIVHCAGLSSPWGRAADFVRHNEIATGHLLQARPERFIYMSSAGVYFCLDERENVPETAALPSSVQHPYLMSKRRCEELVREAPDWVILRPRAIYGPGDTAILPRLLRLMKSGFLPLIGSGENLASLTYVQNLAIAVELSLTGPTTSTFNVTDGEPVVLWPLLRQIIRQLDLPPIRWRIPVKMAEPMARLVEVFYQQFLPRREPPITPYTLSLLTKSQTLDITRARTELNYRPSITTEEAVFQTIQRMES